MNYLKAENSDFRLILLAEFGGELSLEYLRQLIICRFPVHSIVFIGDQYDEYRQKLVTERTQGVYEHLSLIDLLRGRAVPCYFIDDVNSRWSEEVLRFLNPDLVVSGCTKIISRHIWQIPACGILNCHSGFIQRYRGCSSVEWAIYNDDPVGSSCHLIDDSIDSGPLVHQAALNLRKGDEYHQVRAKMIRHQAIVMAKGANKVLSNPRNFSRRVKKGKYYKPMKNKNLLRKVMDKLKDQKYSHYNMPGSIDINYGQV